MTPPISTTTKEDTPDLTTLMRSAAAAASAHSVSPFAPLPYDSCDSTGPSPANRNERLIAILRHAIEIADDNADYSCWDDDDEVSKKDDSSCPRRSSPQ